MLSVWAANAGKCQCAVLAERSGPGLLEGREDGAYTALG